MINWPAVTAVIGVCGILFTVAVFILRVQQTINDKLSREEHDKICAHRDAAIKVSIDHLTQRFEEHVERVRETESLSSTFRHNASNTLHVMAADVSTLKHDVAQMKQRAGIKK